MASLTDLAKAFMRVQQAQGRSPLTIRTYRQCITRLVVFIGDDTSSLTKGNLIDFYALRMGNVAPATVWTDWRSHRVWIRWLVDEGELPSDPMVGLKPPRVPIVPVPVLTDENIRSLLATCGRKTALDVRDEAIIRLALDSGARRGELAGLRVEDVDLDVGVARVTGKGKTRIVPMGRQTWLALERYIRTARPTGSLFGLTVSGVGQAFKKRCRKAGLDERFHLHVTRHTFAHRWLAAGGNETDLLTLGGWSPGSRSMLDRYGASARVERAIDAHRRLGLGDRF